MPEESIKIVDAVQLGRVIKNRRKQLKVTQSQLADFCNLSSNIISRIEVGQSDVRLSTLLKISEMLGSRITFTKEED